jgi:hypothetical protein
MTSFAVKRQASCLMLPAASAFTRHWRVKRSGAALRPGNPWGRKVLSFHKLHGIEGFGHRN